MQRLLKLIVGAALLSMLVFGLSGCGAGGSTDSTSNLPALTAGANSVKQGILSSTSQLKSIDIKTSQGQAELNSQIDKNLNALDKSLNALDKSIGNVN